MTWRGVSDAHLCQNTQLISLRPSLAEAISSFTTEAFTSQWVISDEDVCIESGKDDFLHFKSAHNSFQINWTTENQTAAVMIHTDSHADTCRISHLVEFTRLGRRKLRSNWFWAHCVVLHVKVRWVSRTPSTNEQRPAFSWLVNTLFSCSKNKLQALATPNFDSTLLKIAKSASYLQTFCHSHNLIMLELPSRSTELAKMERGSTNLSSSILTSLPSGALSIH